MSNRRRKIRHTSDPRNLGGQIVGPGGPHDQGGVIVDTRRAILLESVVVSTIDRGTRGQSAFAMELSGRINQTTERSTVLFIFGTDGVASVVTELIALVGRASGESAEGILNDITDRMRQLRDDGHLT